MQTKTCQEEMISEYKKKHVENEEAIENLTKDLNLSKEKLQSAEQVRHIELSCLKS